ncbi:DinB family protein [Thermomicrobium sp. 4228-Ro]|uniref:DinB family protein n=1 Tax=Thermomicrobium sp. 4228-Ro TaxID=2993937 RepID=UPI0022494305|nr:DinB family protein [Thermomicrobium sp. 4228-Ro]MCX2726959.1 DinB family protein [Thermomicrobium sp. 4228-Ro]
MLQSLEPLLAYNRWANQTLVRHCRSVDPALLDAAPPAGVYGSIRATLAHIASAEAAYTARLRGEEPQRLPPDADLDQIAASLERTGQALIELAKSIPADRVISYRSPTFGDVSAPAWVIFSQLVVHGCDHRSQLATLFTQFGAPLPPLDVWQFVGIRR